MQYITDIEKQQLSLESIVDKRTLAQIKKPSKKVVQYDDVMESKSQSLAKLTADYGEGNTVGIIALILVKIITAIKTDDTWSDSRLMESAQNIYDSDPHIKLDEIHLFVKKFIQGDYGKIMRVDANAIGVAWKQFIDEKWKRKEEMYLEAKARNFEDESKPVDTNKRLPCPDEYKVDLGKVFNPPPVKKNDVLNMTAKQMIAEYIRIYKTDPTPKLKSAHKEAEAAGFICDWDTYVRIMLRTKINPNDKYILTTTDNDTDKDSV